MPYTWTNHDDSIAENEGWYIRDRKIVRVPHSYRFETDTEAREHVEHQAEQGSSLHVDALEYVGTPDNHDTILRELQALAETQKIRAVKLYRAIYNVSLSEALAKINGDQTVFVSFDNEGAAVWRADQPDLNTYPVRISALRELVGAPK